MSTNEGQLTVSDVLKLLKGVVKTGGGYAAFCPAHDDKKRSLSIGTGKDGKLLLNCFAGCEFCAIVKAFGQTLPPATSAFLAVYDYCDEAGELQFQVCRGTNKKFLQRRPDGSGNWVWGLARIIHE